MHYFSDPKTGRLMKAEDFLRRERKEWGQAFGAVAKELFSFSKKQGKNFVVTSEADLKKLLGSAHDFKRRR